MASASPVGNAVFVTQYYRPEAIGSGPFCGDIAEALAGRGFRVRVLTTRPHYPDGIVFPPYRRGRLDRQRIDGVDVQRIRTLVSAGRSTRRRMAGEASFFLHGLAAVSSGRLGRADVVISLCPSILAVVLANRLARGRLARGHMARGRARHVAIVHDIQSGLAEGLGMTQGRIVRALRAVERAALNACDLVVVLSEDMRQRLRDNGVTSRVLVVPIWSDTEAIRPLPAAPGPARIALYSGNMGRKQGLMQLVDLADELRTRGSSLRLVLRGRGNQAEVIGREIAARALDNVSLDDLLARERLSEGLAEGDIHLVPQDPAAADFAVPSKIYGIMAAARPFVATAGPGSTLWRLQQKCGAFLCVPPNDARSFADAITLLAENEGLRREMGDRGLSYVTAHCGKDKILGRLMAAIATV
jgi:colanic acid biosynthesis glycosyl transferase WcaI